MGLQFPFPRPAATAASETCWKFKSWGWVPTDLGLPGSPGVPTHTNDWGALIWELGLAGLSVYAETGSLGHTLESPWDFKIMPE